MSINFLDCFIESHFSDKVFNHEIDFRNSEQEISAYFEEFLWKVSPFPSAVSSWKCFSYSEGDYEYEFAIENNDRKLRFILLQRKLKGRFPNQELKKEYLDRPMTEDEIRQYGVPALVQCGASWLTRLEDRTLVSDRLRHLLCQSSNLKVIKWLSTSSELTLNELSSLIWTASRLFVTWENEFERFLKNDVRGTRDFEQAQNFHQALNRWKQPGTHRMMIFGFPVDEPWETLASLVRRKDITIDILRFLFKKLGSIETKDKDIFPVMLAKEVDNTSILLDLILEGTVPGSVKSVVDERLFA